MTNEKVKVTLPEGMTPEEFARILKSFSMKAKKPASKDYVEFARFECGYEQEIRVYRDVFTDKKGNEHEVNSIRRFYLDNETGEWKHGKGVTFDYEHIEQIIEGLMYMKEWHEETYAEGKSQFKQGDD